jgi:hypothetical protein
MQQMLEAWRATDANDADAEKTSVVAELLALVTSTADYGASNATSAD